MPIDIHARGEKHRCFQCQAAFYDLKRPKLVCPRCGADQADAAKAKPAPKKARKPAPAPIKAAEPEEAGEEEEDDVLPPEPEDDDADEELEEADD